MSQQLLTRSPQHAANARDVAYIAWLHGFGTSSAFATVYMREVDEAAALGWITTEKPPGSGEHEDVWRITLEGARVLFAKPATGRRQ